MLFSKSVLNSRITKLQAKLQEEKLDALLISSSSNRFYLTGWNSDIESGYLLITQQKCFLLTDSRYTEEALEKVSHFELREYNYNQDFWSDLASSLKLVSIGFESKDLSVYQRNRLQKLSKVPFRPTIDMVENLRSVKDIEEVKRLSQAAAICDQTFDHILKEIRVGQTEKELAWEIEKYMRFLGADKNAWNPLIVGAGENSSKIHYAPADRKIKKGDQILLDWGCVYQGYSSDISRVVFLGVPTEKQVLVYKWLLEAQNKGIDEVKVGNLNRNVDLVAREFLEKETKFGFGHAVGHGVGVEVHEYPSVNFRSKEKLELGNVITVEPGIYEPGWGGMRIEDMVLVKKNQAEVLTKSPKQIKQVIVK